eukprot:10539838-Karenia_brevis.AAC.1
MDGLMPPSQEMEGDEQQEQLYKYSIYYVKEFMKMGESLISKTSFHRLPLPPDCPDYSKDSLWTALVDSGMWLDAEADMKKKKKKADAPDQVVKAKKYIPKILCAKTFKDVCGSMGGNATDRSFPE